MPKTPAPALYRLVVFEEVEEPPEVRDLVCQVTQAHPTDAMQWIARLPGVWPHPLPEDQVRALLDGLYDLEVAAEAWRVDQFPDLSPPRTVHVAACLSEGFRVGGLRGEPTHWAPWEKIELVSAGRIEAEDEFRNVHPPSWTSALMAGFQALTRRPGRLPPRRARAQRIPRDPVGEVIIVRRDPLIAFRIVENQMNYAYLGERLNPSAAENFPLLVADLVARADDAYITPATYAFLERRKPREHSFPSSQALLDYSTHRLLWGWYRRDRDAGRSTTW
jgi:hypothetical protein